MAGWEEDLERWLMPFLDRLGHKLGSGRVLCTLRD